MASQAAAAQEAAQAQAQAGTLDAVSRIGQGLVSCFQVQELQRPGPIRSLCLHGNSIPRIEGLQLLTALQELNLSSNSIAGIENLAGLASLTSLNLASNKIQVITGLDGLSSLTHLNLSYNYITSLAGLNQGGQGAPPLPGPGQKLRLLNLKQNLLGGLQSLSVLVSFTCLRHLSVEGNPLCQLPNYRQALLSVLPQITQLDSLNSSEALSLPFDMHAAQQLAALRLQAFEMPPQPPSPPRLLPPAWREAGAGGQALLSTAQRGAASGQLQRPAAPRQLSNDDSGFGVVPPGGGHSGLAAQDMQPPGQQQQQQQQRSSANWLASSSNRRAVGGGGAAGGARGRQVGPVRRLQPAAKVFGRSGALLFPRPSRPAA